MLPGVSPTNVSALEIHLNRERPRVIDAPGSFVADGPFDVALVNHGGGAHVHLALDEPLARAARLRAETEYVDRETTASVGVEVADLDQPVTGTLTVSTGYGTETERVELRVEPSRAEGYGIDVDEDLGQPQSEPSIREALDAESIGLLVLAGGALLAAVAVAVLIESPIVVAAAALVALVTVVGVVVALM